MRKNFTLFGETILIFLIETKLKDKKIIVGIIAGQNFSAEPALFSTFFSYHNET